MTDPRKEVEWAKGSTWWLSYQYHESDYTQLDAKKLAVFSGSL